MQLVRFLVVGVLNTAVGLACIVAAMRWLALDYRLANAGGYAAGCGLGFVLNRAWVFGDQGPWQGSLARWLGVVGACWGLNLAAVVLLHVGLGVDVYAAQLGGVVTYTGAAFMGGRLFAFRAPGRTFMDTSTI